LVGAAYFFGKKKAKAGEIEDGGVTKGPGFGAEGQGFAATELPTKANIAELPAERVEKFKNVEEVPRAELEGS
jgi:hypothetical protein